MVRVRTNRWPWLGLALVLAAAGACGTKPPAPPAPSATPYAGDADLAGVDLGPLRGRRILIDPGHGGRFTGTTGRDSTREADVNLGVALHLWGLLRDAGADVHLTRHSDRDLLPDGASAVRDDLAARVAILDSLQPDVFLSLHHNSNAALDRERNAIETYYKLDDDGPSYDLGAAIHAELVGALGIAEARLRPGNYFVLRGAATAAVLGEASYLSNPGVESQLQLAAKQRLEAVAYCRGLARYFARGASAIAKRGPERDTLRTGDAIAFTAAEAIDPSTIEVRAGDHFLPAAVDADGRGFTARCDLPPGVHTLQARVRLGRGNAARPWLGTLVVHAEPAHAFLEAEAAAGGRVRLAARCIDAAGRPVGDGQRVAWTAERASVLDADSTLRGDVAVAVVQSAGSGARVTVRCGEARAALDLGDPQRAAPVRLVRCLDARDGRTLAEVWGPEGRASDRRGWLAVPAAGDVQATRRGYEPWRGALADDTTVRLVPLHGGVLHDVAIVLDPAGDGGDPALPGMPFAAADADHDICSRLASQLTAAGARPSLTRGRADRASDLDRVRSAADSDWFVRVEATVDAGTPVVLHYPGSTGGERLARAIAATWSARSGVSVTVRAESRTVLQQTPSPAVWLLVPAKTCATLDARRELAYVIGCGLRITLDESAASRPPLVGRVTGAPADVVVLDGADVVPVGTGGRFRFEHVPAGTRTLQAVGAMSRSVTVVAAGADTTRVTIASPTP